MPLSLSKRESRSHGPKKYVAGAPESDASIEQGAKLNPGVYVCVLLSLCVCVCLSACLPRATTILPKSSQYST